MRESATPSDIADATEPEPLAYSVPKAAKALSMGPRTVWNLVWSNKIRSYKVGKSVRISRQALLDFIEQQEKEA